MAEKIKIAELQIDTKALLTELSDTKKAIDDLVESQKESKKQGDTSSKTFVENEAKLKTLRKEYANQIKAVQSVSGANEKLNQELAREIKSNDQAKESNAELRKIRNQINESTEEGAKAIAEINKKIDENTKFINKNSDSFEKQKQNVGNYTKSIEAAKIGTKAFGAALKALGVGLIVAAVAKLSEAFTRNQKVMDTVNTVFNTVAIVFDKVVGSIVDGVEAAYEATGGFDALFRVMESLLTLALTPIQVTFYGLKLGIQETQLAWEKSFLGGKDVDRIKELETGIKSTTDKLKELAAEAIIAGQNIKQDFNEAVDEIATIGNKVAESTAEAIRSIDLKQVVAQAKGLTDARNNTEALIIAQERLMLQYQMQAEQLRQLRDDDSKSFDERKAANEELGQLLLKQADAERAMINLKIRAAQNELSLNRGNIELQNEVLRLRNELLEVEERITGQQSEQLANQNALRNEELAAIQEFENKKKELRDQIDLANIEDERLKAEEKLQRDFERQQLELENLQLNEQQKGELLALLEESRQQQLAEIQDTYRQENLKKDIQAEKSKVAAREETLDAIIGLAGQESAIGKAALIAKQVLALKEHALNLGLFTSKAALATAEATTDIAKGTAKSAAAAPFPANIPLIAGFIGSVAGIIATIKGAVSKGKSVAPPKAERGMLLRGPRHSGGGVLIEAEGGEAIMNRNATSRYLPLLSALNSSTGGVPFMEQGGIAGSTSFSSGSIIDYERLGYEVAKANMSLPNPVVSVEEINSTNSRVSAVESIASF